jgi:hypothetical protein
MFEGNSWDAASQNPVQTFSALDELYSRLIGKPVASAQRASIRTCSGEVKIRKLAQCEGHAQTPFNASTL